MIENVEFLLGASAVVLDVGAIALYIWGVFYRGVRPHLFSWLIWTVIMSIAFAAQVAGGGAAGSWLTLSGAVLCFVVFCLSWFKGEKSGSASDWVCLVTALCAIPLWLLTDGPLLAVLLLTGIDLLGYGPTYRKAWLLPYSEYRLVWFLNTVKFLPALLVMGTYSLTTTLYPAAIASANLVLVVILSYRREVLG